LVPLGLSLAVAVVVVEARFHGVTWSLISVLIATMPWVSQKRWAQVVFILWLGGVADSSRILLVCTTDSEGHSIKSFVVGTYLKCA
jgi:hypothetical protein